MDDNQFAQTGAKIGSDLKIRLPNRFEIRSGAVMDTKDLSETSVTLSVTHQRGVDVNFSSAELTLDLDDFSTRILKPAMSRLATEIDYILLGMYADVYNLVGTPGTTPATALVALKAGEKLEDYSAPADENRFMCINPAANATMVDALKGLFHASKDVASQYKRGKIGADVLGFDWGMSQNINRHTTGAFAGTVLVNDTAVDGDSTISMDAFTDAAPTVKKGDVFTIAGVNGLNPDNQQSLGTLQQFVVTADKTGSANAITDIAFSPSLVVSGAAKTVDALPVDNAAVTFVGSPSTAYPQNLAYHRDAFAVAFADLEMPRGADFAAREVMDGISMRIWRDGDIVNDKFPCRIDVYFGYQTIRRELAVRLIG